MMSSGSFLPASVCTKQKPTPFLEASVNNLIGSCGSKCRKIGPAGFVMISFTFLSAASWTSSQTNLLDFFNRSCQDVVVVVVVVAA